MHLELAHPCAALDPNSTDPHAEAARLRAFGPVVPVELPHGTKAWITTTDAAARTALTHPLLLKDPAHWRAYQAGHVRPDSPLIALAVGETMLNKDGGQHARLRVPVAKAFTRRPVESYRQRIAQITTDLLGRLGERADDVVDLKAGFAFPLPMAVICHLLGIDDPDVREQLGTSAAVLLSSTAAPEQIAEAHSQAQKLLSDLATSKQRHPGDDLTTQLVRAHHDGQVTRKELIDSLLLLVSAGHDTTINLITSAALALLAHPGQLAIVRTGTCGWDAVIEETLRFDPPVQRIFFRFASQDMSLEGVRIAEGDPLIIGLAAAGRDPDAYESPERFDITRPPSRIGIGFGLGAHYCLGAALARLEADIALPALFDRFPNLALAADDIVLTRVPSQAMNGVSSLPVRLRPAARSASAA